MFSSFENIMQCAAYILYICIIIQYCERECYYFFYYSLVYVISSPVSLKKKQPLPLSITPSEYICLTNLLSSCQLPSMRPAVGSETRCNTFHE